MSRTPERRPRSADQPLVYMTFGTVLDHRPEAAGMYRTALEAAVVVCHGGSGTTFGALAAGVPVVICPLFADQPQNGHAVQDAAAGVVVLGKAASVGRLRFLEPESAEALHAAIEEMLDQPAYRAAATRIASEMATMPPLDEVVSGLLLEESGTA